MSNRIYVADKDTLDEVNGKADEIKASLQSVKEDTAKIETSIMSVSSGGIAPDNMRFFSVQPADGKVKIKFQEPKDTYIDDQLICTWKGVKIVMKEGGYPEMRQMVRLSSTAPLLESMQRIILSMED